VSTTQWIVPSALGLALLLVFGCWGGLPLTCLTWQPPTKTPAASLPPDTPSSTVPPTPAQSATIDLPANAPGPPTATSTTVTTLSTPKPIPLAGASTRYPTQTQYPTYASVPTAPRMGSAAPASPPRTPPVDTRCAAGEKACDQQTLANMEARRAPDSSWAE
jgi:hypothetical protein